MTILEGDIKLLASRVMDDVPEGGGGPSATVIADGVSNAIFTDISEMDRARGAVHMRQVFPSVQTPDTEQFLGANMIVATLPQDPRVSATLFSTGETFDTRDQARARLEAYLGVGSAYQGFLFGNHIKGMRTIVLWQRAEEVPPVGVSLILRKREGFPEAVDNPVRVTEVSSVLMTFTDNGGEFQRRVVTLKIADALRHDLAGFDVTRIDPTGAELAAKTRINNTVVADAARYYGAVPLEQPITLGAYFAKAAGIYTQLVPSAQIESPIVDSRTNQLSAGLVKTGAAVTQTITLAFTTTQNLFVGGGILPGTLSVVRSGITLTDTGGILYASGAEVGAVDYENGILSLTTNIFGASAGDHQITYTPAAVPSAVQQSIGIPVTISNRSLSWVLTLLPIPAKASLSLSYRAQGRWYVLREDGAGRVKGLETGYGAGTLNYTTGSIVATLGALPDVGSAIVLQWVAPQASVELDASLLANDAKLYMPLNSDGAVTTERGSKAFERNGVTVRWMDGATQRTATDNGAGQLTGDATGLVDYPNGVARISPTILPAHGTVIELETQSRVLVPQAITMAAGAAGKRVGNLGATDVVPGTITLTIPGAIRVTVQEEAGEGKPPVPVVQDISDQFRFIDNGAGALGLQANGRTIAAVAGAVDYATGDFSIEGSITVSVSDFRYLANRTPFYGMNQAA